MNNEFTGDVELKINGVAHTIKFDWHALAVLKSSFTEAQLDKILSGTDLTKLATLLAIGLQRHHPNINESHILNNPPALVPAMAAIEKALTFAYFGADGPPVEDDESPAQESEKKSKSKTTKKK